MNAAWQRTVPSLRLRRYATHKWPTSALRPLWPELFRWLGCPIGTITLANILPVAIAVTVQSIHYKAVCPYSAHEFVDVLAKVRYINNAGSIVQACIQQVCSEAFEDG